MHFTTEQIAVLALAFLSTGAFASSVQAAPVPEIQVSTGTSDLAGEARSVSMNKREPGGGAMGVLFKGLDRIGETVGKTVASTSKELDQFGFGAANNNNPQQQ